MKKQILKQIIAIVTLITIIVSCSSSDSSSDSPSIVAPTVTTTTATSIGQSAAISGGNVTSDGGAAITARGVCWATTTNPTTADPKTIDSGTTGVYTSALSGLSANTVYYVRAYATNSVGTAYGAQISFTTTNVTVALPTLTTTSATSITQTTASSGGNVTNQGGAPILARGVCWSTTANPTIANDKTTDAGTTGAFTSSITGLIANTAYYVKAYATNSGGTAYGSQVTFTTLATSTGPVGGNAICNGTQPTAVVTVTSSTGKIWMDRNLGASRAATSKTDYLAYGCLYQWGRGNDGHASVNWTTSTSGTPVNGYTSVLSTTDTPLNSLFITNNNSPSNWRNPNNNNLWQGVNGINNPCPTGYRLPTLTELQDEFTEYSINNANAAFNSIHKFVLAGYRSGFTDGALGSQGEIGWYWTSGATSSTGDQCSFDATSADIFNNNVKAMGTTVRCIKN